MRNSSLMNTDDIIDIIDFYEPKLKRREILVTTSIALLVGMVSGTILELNGFSRFLILIIVALFFFPGSLLHEGLHYVFQWYFSKQKPHLGFKFPYPYSALSPTSFITRNQAIWCALAPAVILTLILAIPALFTSLPFRILLLSWAAVELASCYTDLYFTYRLLKHPSSCLLKNVNLRNVLFKPKS